MTKSGRKMKPGRKNKKSGHDLKEFEISINSFGEIQSNFDIDEINDYLNRNLRDKKLKRKSRKKEDKNQ